MADVLKFRGLLTGRRFRVEPKAFDSGGGGRICAIVGRPRLVAKLFPNPAPQDGLLATRLRALAARGLRTSRVVCLVDVLVDATGEVAGLVMKRVRGHTLYSFANPVERKHLGITVTLLDRVTIAAETAAAIADLHALKIVLADAHHRNVMVRVGWMGRVAGAVLLEPDTWVFECRSPYGGLEWLTSLARGDFLPKELQGADLSRVRQTYASDAFALSILVSYCLFDCSPFAYAGGSQVPVEERIKAGYSWVTGNLPKGATPPPALPTDPDTVPDAVWALLERGLSDDPLMRPEAKVVATALRVWRAEVARRAWAEGIVRLIGHLIRGRAIAAALARVADLFVSALGALAPAAARKSGRLARHWGKFVGASVVVATAVWWLVWPTPPPDASGSPPAIEQPASRPAAASGAMPTPQPAVARPAPAPDAWRKLLDE